MRLRPATTTRQGEPMTAEQLRALIRRFDKTKTQASSHVTNGEDCNMQSHRQTDDDVACMVAAMALAEAVSKSPEVVEALLVLEGYGSLRALSRRNGSVSHDGARHIEDKLSEMADRAYDRMVRS